MHEDSNSHSTVHFFGNQLPVVDFMVQAGCRLSWCYRGKSNLVRHPSHLNAILDDLQLLLDVLRGRSSSFGTRCRIHQGQHCDANFLLHWLDTSPNLYYNLWHHAMAQHRGQQIVRFSHEFGIRLKVFDCRCWIEESHYMWILIVPVIILLVCSTIFLINIVRVLITKLHPKSASPAPLAIKKAVRATLILVMFNP